MRQKNQERLQKFSFFIFSLFRVSASCLSATGLQQHQQQQQHHQQHFSLSPFSLSLSTWFQIRKWLFAQTAINGRSDGVECDTGPPPLPPNVNESIIIINHALQSANEFDCRINRIQRQRRWIFPGMELISERDRNERLASLSRSWNAAINDRSARLNSAA